MAFVYLVTHVASGRSYVGLTKRAPGWRWKEHKERARRGDSFLFARALKKYGAEAFTWRVVWDGPELCVKRIEQQLIRAGLGHFNLTAGGDGLTGLKHKESTKQKMSASAKSRKQQPPPGVGTEAARKVHLGAKRPAEWCQRISHSLRVRKGHENETPEQKLERVRENARQYYRDNRQSVLQKKEAKRRAAGVRSVKPAGLPW